MTEKQAKALKQLEKELKKPKLSFDSRKHLRKQKKLIEDQIRRSKEEAENLKMTKEKMSQEFTI